MIDWEQCHPEAESAVFTNGLQRFVDANHPDKRVYKNRDLARADIFDYIEVFYSQTRRHSHLGSVSPEAFEKASQ